MTGTTNYRKDDGTNEVEQRPLSLIRIKGEVQSRNSDHRRGILLSDCRPRGILIGD